MAPEIQVKDTGFTVLSEGGESPTIEYAREPKDVMLLT